MRSESSTRVMDMKAKQIGYESYADYLKSDHWARLVDYCRGNRCFCCFKTESLSLHHTSYDNLGNESPTDFATVCSGCHESIHGMVRAKKATLENAHFVLRERIAKYGMRSYDCESKWVTNWRKLVNQSKQQSISDLQEFMVDKGLLCIGCGIPAPTEKAFSMGFAKINEDGRAYWNRPKYIALMQADKKLSKQIAKGKTPHEMLTRRAMAQSLSIREA